MAESSEDFKIMMVLQKRHLYDEPLEYLVKCRPRQGRIKEIWMTLSKLLRMENGRKLVKEFNKTKVGERGVDVYLEKRRSIGRKSLLPGEVRSPYDGTSTAPPNDNDLTTMTNSSATNGGRKIGNSFVERSSTLSGTTAFGFYESKKEKCSWALCSLPSSSSGARHKNGPTFDASVRHSLGSSKRKPKSSSSSCLRHSVPTFLSNRKTVKRPISSAKQDLPAAEESSNTRPPVSSLNSRVKYEYPSTAGSDDRSIRSASSELSSSNNNNNNYKDSVKITTSKRKQDDHLHVGSKKYRTTDFLDDTDPDSEVDFKMLSNANSSEMRARLVAKNLKPERSLSTSTPSSTLNRFSTHLPYSSSFNGSNCVASRQHGTSMVAAMIESMSRSKKMRINMNASGEEESPVERRISIRQTESAFKFKEIVVRKCPGYMHLVTLSQKEAKNAFNPKVFQELTIALHNSINDDSHVVLLSASGNVFSSGIDIQYLLNAEEDRYTAAKNMADGLRDFINCLISFPKPIVVAVNGPAVGLGMAILPLCDIIYASDKASFSCPYTALCQTPESCSSYTFPKMMGAAMANDILLRGRKITALEAHQIGLISQVFWPDKLMSEVTPRVQNLAAQSLKALECTKVLIRASRRQKLERINAAECQILQERWTSVECQRAMKTYLEQATDDLA